nr:MAG TPA: PcfJ like protein [Caudoviricetes sp.]
MTVDEVLSHFPDEVPAEFLHEADNARPIYLFQTDKEGNTVCGNCGSRFQRYEPHLTARKCPYCQKYGKVVHMTKYHKSEAKSLRQGNLTYHWAPSVINPDILTCTAILNFYWFSTTEPWASKPYRYVDARYIFVPGKGGYYISRKSRFYPEYFYDGEYFARWSPPPDEADWVLRKSCRDRLNAYSATTKIGSATYPQGIADAVEGHALKYVYASMKECINTAFSPVQVLYTIAKYPLQIEYLAKCGFKDVLSTSLKVGGRLGVAFNMRANTLKGILRGKFSKEDMEYIKQHCIDVRTLQRYQQIRRHPAGAGITLEIVNEELNLWSFYTLETIMEHVKLTKALSYISKEKSSITTYADYLRDCEKLEMDFTEKATLFPKGLEKLHVKLQKQIRHKRDEEAQREWTERQGKLKAKYSFEADGYAIVIPEEINDLIREGKDMHNCVGSYISRVASGKTDVVYIRKVAEINKSLGTMEINGGCIVQARGKYNQDLPKEVQDFVDKFRKEVLEKKKGRKTA